jgi:hypothetical protein
MQSIGGNLLQDLGNYANHNGKRERGISTTFLRARSEDGTQSLFSISSKRLSIHANVPKEKVGWICLSLQHGQW